MQTWFVGCEMYNKINPYFSLCIVCKRAKERRWTRLKFGLLEHKLATKWWRHFASKVTMFEQCLTYQAIVLMCYNNQIKALANRILLHKLR